MATVNKNFRIKHGLVVEGSTATVNGQNILTETGSDQYILDLVGGENLIDSVASGLSVDANSQLSIDRTVVDGWYDSNGAAAAALSDAQDYADTAEADAVTSANAYTDGRETAITTAYEAYADQAETDAVASAQAALDDVLDGTTAFSEVNLYDLTSQRAVQGFVTTAQEGSSMISWAKSDYGTAKAWVKFATPTHSQISEVLLTTDSTGNISITEFGMVGTNGSLGSVGASYLNGNIAIEVDTVHAATTVTVVATLIK